MQQQLCNSKKTLEHLYVGNCSDEKLPTGDRDVSSTTTNLLPSIAQRRKQESHRPSQTHVSDSNKGPIELEFFIECFPGIGGLAVSVRAGTVLIYIFDINNCKRGNILDKDTYKRIRTLMFLEIPCCVVRNALQNLLERPESLEQRMAQNHDSYVVRPDTAFKPAPYCMSTCTICP